MTWETDMDSPKGRSMSLVRLGFGRRILLNPFEQEFL